uniref:Putative LOC100883738 [Megachile rotundata] n=1 Tax=Lepeophtheirus salmonis TaxID=72036 RepID=A0A0K2TSW5_LEPSM
MYKYTVFISGDGYLLALASRYAFELNVEHRDVLRSLEDLRWEEENVHTYANTGLLIDRSTSSMQLKVPLKPGRYASSSCLSDKDDDIYDYTPEDETPPPSTTISSARSVHPTLSAGWYRRAKRAMCRNNGSSTMNNKDFKSRPFHDPLSPSTPILTRTRLRPGGPPESSTLRNIQQPLSDEEISMRTLGLRQPRLKSREPLFPVSSAFYGTLSNSSSKPATPLVKQRTAGSASPRVQMYRTRVVYSDSVEAPPNGRITVTTARTNSHEAAV